MKRFGWKWALALVLLLAPINAQAAEVRNIFSDMSGTLWTQMNEWLTAAAASNAKDLDVVLTVDQTALCEGESAQVRVELINPRLYGCTVTLHTTVSHAQCVEVTGDKTQETIALPAARVEADGSITPGRVERAYSVTMREGVEEGYVLTTVAASMQEGSRWYQQTRQLALCAPQISAVLRATNSMPAPQDAFFYEVALLNSGGAADEVEVAVQLPDGVTYAPAGRSRTATENEAAEQALAALNAQRPDVQGNTLHYTVRVPAAQYDGTGKLEAPVQYTLRVPVTVDAQALEEEPSAVRELSCGAMVDGIKLQEARVTVRGPLIDCTLTPALRDMEMGGTLHYTCEVCNSGYAPADVRVTFQVPDGMKFTRFVTRGLQNRVAGDTLSWVVHLDAAEFDLAGEAIPAKTTLSFQVQAEELENGVSALLVPATAVYQIGEGGKAVATDVALTTIHRPTVLGLSGGDWFFVGWAGVILVLTVAVLLALIRRDGEKGD